MSTDRHPGSTPAAGASPSHVSPADAPPSDTPATDATATSSAARPGSHSGTVVKALDLLTRLGEHPGGVTAGQAARETSLPFSTCYRLLNTLVATGFAHYEPTDKRYHLGLRVFRLAHAVASHQGFEGSAAPVLHRLTQTTQESSILHVLDGDRALTVHTEDGPQFRTTTDPGDRAALHTTASGKVLLAFSEPAVRDELLRHLPLEQRTPRSVTDRDELLRQLELAREQGWTSQSEEHDLGMAAIAAPVLSPAGRLLGAVTLAAPLFRRTREQLEEHVPALLEATGELGLILPSR